MLTCVSYHSQVPSMHCHLLSHMCIRSQHIRQLPYMHCHLLSTCVSDHSTSVSYRTCIVICILHVYPITAHQSVTVHALSFAFSHVSQEKKFLEEEMECLECNNFLTVHGSTYSIQCTLQRYRSDYSTCML